MALVDLETDQAGAVAVGRVGHGLARAAEVAAAILDVLAFNAPVSGHDFSSLASIAIVRILVHSGEVGYSFSSEMPTRRCW